MEVANSSPVAFLNLTPLLAVFTGAFRNFVTALLAASAPSALACRLRSLVILQFLEAELSKETFLAA